MAGLTGLEPATSGVTGRRSNRAELQPRGSLNYNLFFGGRKRIRTSDPRLVRPMLSH